MDAPETPTTEAPITEPEATEPEATEPKATEPAAPVIVEAAPPPPDTTVVLQDPGKTLTSTGEVIVDEDVSDEDFEAALEATLKPMNEHDLVEGVVVKVDPDEVLLDIGYKSEGVIPARELSIKSDIDPNEVVAVGDLVEAMVLDREDELGRIVLSKKRAQYERAWGTIERIYTDDKTVTGTVIEVVKGGLILDIGLRGFLPASLVEMRRVRDLQPFVGDTLECKVIELDKHRNNVVLSRRKFLEETQSEFRLEFLESLQKGEVRNGAVSSIVNFGAFVDLGGVDGLVHVSELSWQHIDHPSEVVEVGDEVQVEVLEVDMERERVSLSLKSTQEDPWRRFARENDVGSVVEGAVTKLVPFGAFVKVADGIEGLVHISELSERHVEVPEAVVNVGDKVEVKVIDVDTVRRRVSLSLKQADETEEAETEHEAEAPAEAAYTSGDEAESSMAHGLRQAGLTSEDEADTPTEGAEGEAAVEQPEVAEADEPAADEPPAEEPAVDAAEEPAVDAAEEPAAEADAPPADEPEPEAESREDDSEE